MAKIEMKFLQQDSDTKNPVFGSIVVNAACDVYECNEIPNWYTVKKEEDVGVLTRLFSKMGWEINAYNMGVESNGTPIVVLKGDNFGGKVFFMRKNTKKFSWSKL